MTIRKAQARDVQRIAELLCTIAKLHHDGRPDIYAEDAKYDAGEVSKIVKDKKKTVFVSVDDNDYVMGYIICYEIKRTLNIEPKEAVTLYVDDLCVDKDFSHHGIGKALLLKARDYAKDAGCYNVELNVWSFNENAVKFYESCGMTEQRKRMEFIV